MVPVFLGIHVFHSYCCVFQVPWLLQLTFWWCACNRYLTSNNGSTADKNIYTFLTTLTFWWCACNRYLDCCVLHPILSLHISSSCHERYCFSIIAHFISFDTWLAVVYWSLLSHINLKLEPTESFFSWDSSTRNEFMEHERSQL